MNNEDSELVSRTNVSEVKLGYKDSLVDVVCFRHHRKDLPFLGDDGRKGRSVPTPRPQGSALEGPGYCGISTIAIMVSPLQNFLSPQLTDNEG
jgi:hypothetical protein